jgi:hypothetical protein
MVDRATFRPVQDDVAWQRQLRDRFNGDGVPRTVPHLDLKRAVVRPVSRRLAESVILKYEWLGTMAQTSLHFGIFFGDYCAGVTCAGPCCTGGSPHKLWKLDPHEFIVLARGACVHWAPTGTNSKLVSWTVKLLRKMRTAGFAGKLLAAYADSDAGEIGTIYQACGWHYVGRSSGTLKQWVAPNGRIYDTMKPRDFARQRGGTRMQWVGAMRRAGWREQATNPKHRYVQLLDVDDKPLADRVRHLVEPYPKRERSADSGAADDQSAGGGASPTRSLQLSRKHDHDAADAGQREHSA